MLLAGMAASVHLYRTLPDYAITAGDPLKVPSKSASTTMNLMTFVAMPDYATARLANSRKFNSCWSTRQSKRQNGTSDAGRSSEMLSTIDSKYRRQSGHDNPVYHAPNGSGRKPAQASTGAFHNTVRLKKINVLVAIPEPQEWQDLPVNTAAGLEAD
jgi:hypothetical protein